MLPSARTHRQNIGVLAEHRHRVRYPGERDLARLGRDLGLEALVEDPEGDGRVRLARLEHPHLVEQLHEEGALVVLRVRVRAQDSKHLAREGGQRG